MVKSNFRPKIRSSSRVGSDALGVKAGGRLVLGICAELRLSIRQARSDAFF
jgi:hypothetical protein